MCLWFQLHWRSIAEIGIPGQPWQKADPSSKTIRAKRVKGMAQVVEYLSSKRSPKFKFQYCQETINKIAVFLEGIS
jgi:hypothetical protein